VELGPALLASGFDLVACVSGDDPWTQAAWSKQFDPQHAIRFLSDGNLDFGRTCGLTTMVKDLFLGECMQRFSMIVDNMTVQKLHIEASVLHVTCSSAEACLDESLAAAAE
jgi:peroxiredoxin